MGTKLLVSNLAPDIDSSALEDMFTIVGDVRLACVERDAATGASMGFGRIEMFTDEAARDGIDHFNGQSARGRRLVVSEDRTGMPPLVRPELVNRRAATPVSRRKR